VFIDAKNGGDIQTVATLWTDALKGEANAMVVNTP
jgi:hypothetical protein